MVTRFAGLKLAFRSSWFFSIRSFILGRFRAWCFFVQPHHCKQLIRLRPLSNISHPRTDLVERCQPHTVVTYKLSTAQQSSPAATRTIILSKDRNADHHTLHLLDVVCHYGLLLQVTPLCRPTGSLAYGCAPLPSPHFVLHSCCLHC
jgi:hypothetical protein